MHKTLWLRVLLYRWISIQELFHLNMCCIISKMLLLYLVSSVFSVSLISFSKVFQEHGWELLNCGVLAITRRFLWLCFPLIPSLVSHFHRCLFEGYNTYSSFIYQSTDYWGRMVSTQPFYVCSLFSCSW